MTQGKHKPFSSLSDRDLLQVRDQVKACKERNRIAHAMYHAAAFDLDRVNAEIKLRSK